MENYLNKTISVSGYLISAAGNYILVSDPAVFFNNSLDRSNHIVMADQVPETFSTRTGFLICVKGLFFLYDSSDDTGGMIPDSFFDIETELTEPGIYVDAMEPMRILEEYPWWHDFDFTEEKYAVLYSGGWKDGKDYYRYWNDIIYMYVILLMHDYKPDNIYIVYKDGVSEDGIYDVDYPASHESMDTVFGILEEEMGRLDTLFFYTTNHGGSGGISCWNPVDASVLTHTEVSDWLDAITCKQMIIVMEQCVSGKFISHLSAPDRVILTACMDNEGSAGCDTEGCWDEFVYHFMCALISYSFHDPQLVVDADIIDIDGRISLKEAFVYASFVDSRAETPWYNDYFDGSTEGYTDWEVIFQLSGSAGDNVFL